MKQSKKNKKEIDSKISEMMKKREEENMALKKVLKAIKDKINENHADNTKSDNDKTQ